MLFYIELLKLNCPTCVRIHYSNWGNLHIINHNNIIYLVLYLKFRPRELLEHRIISIIDLKYPSCTSPLNFLKLVGLYIIFIDRIPYRQAVCSTFKWLKERKMICRHHNCIEDVHLIVIPGARMICMIYAPEARGLRVYISGEPRVHMV